MRGEDGKRGAARCSGRPASRSRGREAAHASVPLLPPAPAATGVLDANALVAAALANLTGYAPPSPSGPDWARCELANATISCASLEAGAPTLLLVYNPRSQTAASLPVRIPVGLPPGVASWAVTGPDGVTRVPAQLLPASRRDVFLRETYYGAPAAPMQARSMMGRGGWRGETHY